MKLEEYAKIKDIRQDGAIYGGYLFSFNNLGKCTVYRMSSLEAAKYNEAEVYSEFTLHKNDLISPHSNSVMFGCEFYEDGDEFPLLYTNIYNNYWKEEDKLKGVTLVYRIEKTDNTFKTTLVQMIEVGFTENEKLWKSESGDLRPFGNFAIDTDKQIYYAFTMRDATKTTRYFSFKLPKVTEGEMCEKYGVKKVVLEEGDILNYFDCDYHHFVQGACCFEGKIYSLEGFTENVENPPAIRIIDPMLKKQILFKKFEELGTSIEPECINFYEGTCYYVDHHGQAYKLYF